MIVNLVVYVYSQV